MIWSTWKRSAVGPRGHLFANGVLCTTECPNGTKVWVCSHIAGTVSLVKDKPEKRTSPKVVSTNNPKVDRS